MTMNVPTSSDSLIDRGVSVSVTTGLSVSVSLFAGYAALVSASA